MSSCASSPSSNRVLRPSNIPSPSGNAERLSRIDAKNGCSAPSAGSTRHAPTPRTQSDGAALPREPRIAAHLGRPETPAEEAARKAENTKNYRQSQSFRNLIIALVASLAIVAVVYFIVPRGEIAERPAARYRRHRAPGRRPIRSHRDRADGAPEDWGKNSPRSDAGKPLGLVGELQRHSRSAPRVHQLRAGIRRR